MSFLFEQIPLSLHRKLNDEARTTGAPVKYMYRHLYCPDKGMFCSIPDNMVDVSGQYCEVRRTIQNSGMPSAYQCWLPARLLPGVE